jgi:hypothetical protein
MDGANIDRMSRDLSKIGTEQGVEPLGRVARSAGLLSVAGV